MKKYTNKILKTVPYIIIALLVGITAVYAGDLIPSGDQEGTNTMHNLQDIYKLATGGGTSAINSTLTTSPELVGSGNTLNDVYTALSTEINKLADAQIAKDVTSFGFTGTLYGDTDPTQVLTTADYPGTATVGTPAPTFASADSTTYSCEALAVDLTQPAVTLQTICGYHSADGCSWVSSACTGGTKTPADGYMTWYAATASCAEKSDEGSSSWRLPTNVELLTYYMKYNQSGNPPTDFVGDVYWSGTTGQYPGDEDVAYYVYMYDGSTDSIGKSNPGSPVHCVH